MRGRGQSTSRSGGPAARDYARISSEIGASANLKCPAAGLAADRGPPTSSPTEGLWDGEPSRAADSELVLYVCPHTPHADSQNRGGEADASRSEATRLLEPTSTSDTATHVNGDPQL